MLYNRFLDGNLSPMRKPIEIISDCPSCDSPLVNINGVLYCKNHSCPAVLHNSLKHFIKILGIKGLGEQTLSKLCLEGIEDIFTLTTEYLESVLGSKLIANTLIQQIEAAKGVMLDKVITSFGIPLVGRSTASKLLPFISSIDDITYELCREAKLGDKAATNLVKFLEEEFPYYRDKLPFNYTVATRLEKVGDEICITGKLSTFQTKAEAKRALEEKGFIVVDSVRKSTKYLVAENSENSEKYKKAVELNIEIINNLKEFLNDRSS